MSIAGPAAAPSPSTARSVTELQASGTIVGFRLKLAKRVCPSYSIVPGNADQTRNSQTAEAVTGPDPYAGQPDAAMVWPAIEDAPGRPWVSCVPAAGYSFEIGTGKTKVNDLSRVAAPQQVWVDNDDGTASLADVATTTSLMYGIAGMVGVWLTPDQFALLVNQGLYVSEVPSAGGVGFGTLRCGSDRSGGDNLEIPNLGPENFRTYCYAYNAQALPTTTTVLTTTAPAPTTTSGPAPSATTVPAPTTSLVATTLAGSTSAATTAPSVPDASVAPSPLSPGATPSSVLGVIITPAAKAQPSASAAGDATPGAVTLPATGSNNVAVALGLGLLAVGLIVCGIGRRFGHDGGDRL